jgi:hypothetical protein
MPPKGLPMLLPQRLLLMPQPQRKQLMPQLQLLLQRRKPMMPQ